MYRLQDDKQTLSLPQQLQPHACIAQHAGCICLLADAWQARAGAGHEQALMQATHGCGVLVGGGLQRKGWRGVHGGYREGGDA